jgi:hypothetical protein
MSPIDSREVPVVSATGSHKPSLLVLVRIYLGIFLARAVLKEEGVMRRWIFLSPVLMLLSGTPSFARTPLGEFSAGWVFLRSLDAADQGNSYFQSYPIGLQLGGALRIANSVGFAVDYGWNRKSQDVDVLTLRARNDTEGGDWISQKSISTFAVGPRFYFGERATVFVHALFGRSRRAYTSPLADGESSHTYFLIQPGGGVDIRLRDAVAVRSQFDYQWVGDSEGTVERTLRFTIGGVLYLGNR